MSTHPLTQYRQSNGLTLEAFAKDIGASKSMVWKWENGVAEPRAKYRQKIAEKTGISIVALLAWKPEGEAA